MTEGVAPTAVKLGIDTIQWTVAQAGAFTQVTDIAQFESPHNLEAVAAEKVKRLALQNFDAIARTAINAVTATADIAGPLSSDILLDVKAELQSRNVEEIPGVGYYCLLHPNVLTGLEREGDLNGYVNVMAQARSGELTSGAVSQYRGFTFLPSTRWAPTGDAYPVAFLGANVLAAGDPNTLSFHYVKGAQIGNELDQIHTAGFKAIFGAKALAFAEEADGAGTNDPAVNRILRITAYSGVSGMLTI